MKKKNLIKVEKRDERVCFQKNYLIIFDDDEIRLKIL